VGKELLLLKHGESLGTQRKKNIRRFKPVPQDW
jgi:hypothetical protein